MKSIKLRDGVLSVVDQGSGIPILFVHGFPLDHSMWRAQIDFFAQQYRVIAPDLRGFGKSQPPDSQWPRTMSMKDFADDLFQLLDALKIREPIVLCGLSMGGYIGWQFVRHHADSVLAIVMCDTRAGADTAEIARGRRFMADGVVDVGATVATRGMVDRLISETTRRSAPHVAAGLQSTIDSTNPRAIAAAQRGMAERPDSKELLPLLKIPVLFICGEDDQITPAKEMMLEAQNIPDCRVVIIPGAGHMPPIEQSELTNTAIMSFVQSVEKAKHGARK